MISKGFRCSPVRRVDFPLDSRLRSKETLRTKSTLNAFVVRDVLILVLVA